VHMGFMMLMGIRLRVIDSVNNVCVFCHGRPQLIRYSSGNK
jgi:hypothetical protein